MMVIFFPVSTIAGPCTIVSTVFLVKSVWIVQKQSGLQKTMNQKSYDQGISVCDQEKK